VLIAQEERCVQCVNVQFIKKNKSWLATCAPPYSGFYDYRSKTPVRLSIEKHVPLVSISLPRVLEPIPVVIVMRALGISTDKHVMEIVCYDLNDNHLMEVIRPSIEAADSSTLSFLKKQQKETSSTSALNAIRLRNNALAYIGAKVRHNVGPVETAGREVLDLMFLHLGEGDTRKSYFLGYMIRLVCMTYLGRRREDDKDHYKNKRLDLAGQLMKHQFRKNMGHLQRDIAKQIQKHLGKDESLGPLKTFVSESLLTKSLQAAFTTGNWNTSEGPRSSGVVGDLKRMNPIATISQLRQVRHNLDSKSRPPDSARHPYASSHNSTDTFLSILEMSCHKS
jgi:DNA-directed RNA polymerase II subunit RPB2